MCLVDRFVVEAARLMPTGTQPGFLAALVREADHWVIRHRGQVVAVQAVLEGRTQLAVIPQHGLGGPPRATFVSAMARRFAEMDSAAVSDWLHFGLVSQSGQDLRVYP